MRRWFKGNWPKVVMLGGVALVLAGVVVLVLYFTGPTQIDEMDALRVEIFGATRSVFALVPSEGAFGIKWKQHGFAAAGSASAALGVFAVTAGAILGRRRDRDD
jgi:hypothetical protein